MKEEHYVEEFVYKSSYKIFYYYSCDILKAFLIYKLEVGSFMKRSSGSFGDL